MRSTTHSRCKNRSDGADFSQATPTWLIQFPSLVKPEQREALQREILERRERMVREICEALESLSSEAQTTGV